MMNDFVTAKERLANPWARRWLKETLDVMSMLAVIFIFFIVATQ